MVEAVLNEIFSAAENDLAARTLTDKPSYVFHQTFHGPIASIAQGGTSVGTLNQTFESVTLPEMAEAVAAILRALPAGPASGPTASQAKTELETAESELWQGRLSFGRITRALGFLSRAEDIALRAPEVVHAVVKLESMIGLA
jgi:hypothetical protein